MRTYQQTVDWMFQQLPMYQHVGSRAYKTDLSNVLKLSGHLGTPHTRFKSIHVAGTNGKGSVSHMLASVLQEQGFKVGLYTSPHLKDFRERIKINGKEIPQQDVMQFIDKNQSFLEQEHLSFFEMTVGMAFEYFADQEVDVGIIEVGLGGRLDSTNIILPDLSIITNIGYDHTNILGNTLEEIAGEKAGIIKPGIPVVLGESHPETLPVFKKISQTLQSPLFLAEEFSGKEQMSDLIGTYQMKNVRTVLSAVEVLRNQGWDISSSALERGLKSVVNNTGLRGRWEILQEKPKVICDTAHNREGLVYAMQQLLDEDHEQLHIIFGVVSDKDLSSVLPILPKNATFYFCRPNIPRGLDASELWKRAQDYDLKGQAYNSVSEAYHTALNRAGNGDVIYVGGSTFTVAEII